MAVASGCLINLNAYGLRANIRAVEKSLSAEEVKELRAIAQAIATDEYLVELEDYKGEGPDDKIYDEYRVLARPAQNVTLYVAKDRRHAHIQVDDWESAGHVNEWTREVMDRVRHELAKKLPDRTVEVETRDMGFWAP